MPSNDTCILTVRLSNDLAAAVREDAAARGLSVNALLVKRIEAEYARGARVPNRHKSEPERYELEPDE